MPMRVTIDRIRKITSRPATATSTTSIENDGRRPGRPPLIGSAALALRMRVAMAPVERAEAVAAALTAERIDVEAADQSLERADPRAASHALTPAARTPHVDMVQWSDAAARKHS